MAWTFEEYITRSMLHPETNDAAGSSITFLIRQNYHLCDGMLIVVPACIGVLLAVLITAAFLIRIPLQWKMLLESFSVAAIVGSSYAYFMSSQLTAPQRDISYPLFPKMSHLYESDSSESQVFSKYMAGLAVVSILAERLVMLTSYLARTQVGRGIIFAMLLFVSELKQRELVLSFRDTDQIHLVVMLVLAAYSAFLWVKNGTSLLQPMMVLFCVFQIPRASQYSPNTYDVGPPSKPSRQAANIQLLLTTTTNCPSSVQW